MNNENNKIPTKRLLSIKDLVKEYGGTTWFWRTLIWDGQIPYIQPGDKKMFVDAKDVEAFIRNNKRFALTN